MGPQQKRFTELLNRLQEIKVELSGLPQALSQRVRTSTLIDIYNYVQDNANKILRKLLKAKISQSVRLRKTDTSLPFSIAFINDIDGKLKLILDTKSKQQAEDGSIVKCETLKVNGTFKVGKPSWRIDTLAFEKWINLRSDCKNIDTLKNAQSEAETANTIARNSFYVSQSIMTPARLFRSHEAIRHRVNFYAPAAMGTLVDLIDTLIHLTRPLNQEERNQAHNSPFYEYLMNHPFELKEKWLIAEQLVEALKSIHAAGYLHNDIKPQNILLYLVDGKLKVKFTDFGLSSAKNNQSSPIATNGYASPEILLYYSEPKTYLHQYYFTNPQASLGRHYFQRIPSSNGSNHFLTYRQLKQKQQYNSRHFKNDIWALGIVLAELFTDKIYYEITPKDIQHDKLLAGLLAVKRSDRFMLTDALKIIRKRINEIPETTTILYPPVVPEAEVVESTIVDFNPTPPDQITISASPSPVLEFELESDEDTTEPPRKKKRKMIK